METKKKIKEAHGVVGRVYDEGDHPTLGPVCVALMLFSDEDTNYMCFVRLNVKPEVVKVGGHMEFDSNLCVITTTDGDIQSVNKIGGAFPEYTNPGKIFSGG